MLNHRRTLREALFVFVLVSPVFGAKEITLYVAPTGNDTWSGRLPAPSGDGTDGPLATVAAAQRAVRRLPDTAARTVLFRSGVYRLDQPWVFTPADSGTESAPVTYAAYPGEKPVFSGGRRITGFRRVGKLWQAELPEVRAGRWRFLQLFVDGHRRPRARTPNQGYFRMAGPAPPVRGADGKEVSREKSAFCFRPGDLRPWRHLHEVVVVLLHSWETSIHPVKSVDMRSHVVEFAAPLKEWWKIGYWEREGRYFVENAFEFLDEPGEWYLDSETGVLSYLPFPGEDPQQTEVIAPVLHSLVEFRGETRAGLPVQHVHLRGLTFHHADWTLNPEGNSSTQAAVDVPAAIMADGAVACSLENCELAHVGTYGIWLRRGCKDCRLVHNHLFDLGAGGIRLGETAMAKDDADETSRTRVDNNYLHDGGKVFPAGVGIWLAQSSHNVLSHNEIHSFNYSGISLGWNWNEAPNRSHPNTIEFNHVHHVMGRMLSDGGGIYTLGTQTGTVIRNNVFHDIWPYMGRPAMAWGIYMDAGSNGLRVENNLVYNTLTGGIMNTARHHNTIRNNIFALSAWHAAWRYTYEKDPPPVIERNIFYLTQGELFHADGGRTDFKSRWDYNLYWRTDGKPVEFYGLSFAEWRAKGVDRHSLIADPQFVDARHYDFRLAPTSPALTELGFKPLDTSRCGLHGTPEWVALPKAVKFPATVLPPVPPPPAPQPVRDDFETTPVGSLPQTLRVFGDDPTAGSSVRVTDETARSGVHALKVVDSPELKEVWNPHCYYTPQFHTGEAVFRFSLFLRPGALVAVEWRDGRHPYRVGPTLKVDKDGRLVVGSRLLTTVPLQHWVDVVMRCRLGKQATGEWNLTVTPVGADSQRFDNLPCGDSRFNDLEWLGFISLARERTEFYLDRVTLTPVPEAVE